MQNLSQPRQRIDNHFARALRSEVANPDEPFRFENAIDCAEMIVARDKQSPFFARRKFVRRAVAAALLDKRERTIIHDDVIAEKILRGPETLLK